MKEILLNNFLKISSIPRKSGQEEKIADFFCNIAIKNNLYFYKDDKNNVLIKKKGNIESEPIAFQAHLDMVCVETEESNHDFDKDGIQVLIDGDIVTAKDTSLGADQGVGLSMMLALMQDKNLKHPDLEFLFTTEEETTFNGVVNFPYSKVESKRMINLDNSKDNSVFIGSEGDICNEYRFKSSKINSNNPSYKIKISGFPGGNSGDNVNLSKNNAITTMAKLLYGKDLLVAQINGGTFENDIATSCEVIINTNEDVYSIFKNLNANIEKIINTECFDEKDTQDILNQIIQLESGVILENEATANLGTIKTINNEIIINYIFRSMNEEKLQQIYDNTNNLNNRFKVKEIYRDPIWQVDKNSKLLEIYRRLYFNEYGEYPINEINRGAIECASIKKRIDGLDIISIGSNMRYIHTTKEITYISSWCKIYNLLIKLLEIL